MGWIAEFLNKGTQEVSVNGSFSKWTNVTSGVPQGSVLGPVLVMVYINELPLLVENKLKMYADDTKLYGPVASLGDAQKPQHELDVLNKLSEEWSLKFNVAKCKVMHCCAQKPRGIYYMREPMVKPRLRRPLLKKIWGSPDKYTEANKTVL